MHPWELHNSHMWYIKFCTPAYKSLGTSVSRFGVVTSQLCVFSSGPPCDRCSLGYLCLSKLVLSSGYKDSGKSGTDKNTRRKLWPVDQFDGYLERLQEYFTAYDIADDNDNAAKLRAILLTSIGSNCFRVLKDLAFPNTPYTKRFAQLENLLREHFKPARLKIA